MTFIVEQPGQQPQPAPLSPAVPDRLREIARNVPGAILIALVLLSYAAAYGVVIFGSGTIVGEMSLYTGQPRTADVITDGPAMVRKLTVPQPRALEASDPAVALQLHNFVVRTMSTRLAVTNDAYRLEF